MTGTSPGTSTGYPQITIVEEGMREGMQIESASIGVHDKIELLDELSETGLRNIVVGSFVSPKWTPQMAEIDAIVSGFTPVPGVNYTALALNERGRERMRAYMPPLRELHPYPRTLVHVCDVFVRRNTNRSQQAEIEALPAVVQRAAEAGAAHAGIGVNAAWGSNWLGEFSLAQRMDLLRHQHRLWTGAGIGVREVFIGDPMGWNVPDRVAEQLRAIRAEWPEITRFHLHLHNTRGTAPISVYTALRTLDPECELVVDTTIGGMGGCPYCGNGRLTGMMPTEDLVDLLAELGIPTGVDLDRLIEVVVHAEQVIGRELYGHVSKAGPRPRGDRLYAMDMPFIETTAEAQHFRLGPEVYAGALAPWKEAITSPARDAVEQQRRGDAG
ncbi:citramalate synthase [Saccharopolyspora sp. K220]|uniref:citramalate synthase n=1 Tax=Saccharopolyspora soli TaxID=2926618 RepID=UPI001F595D1E|nr:citramalate synthase [Saccharopolyspora soli]MCI2417878.1 citramalate synthase [Saccharopolyspora soli]